MCNKYYFIIRPILTHQIYSKRVRVKQFVGNKQYSIVRPITHQIYSKDNFEYLCKGGEYI